MESTMTENLQKIKSKQTVTLAESIESAFIAWEKSNSQTNFFDYYVREIEKDGGVICNKCNLIHHSNDKDCSL